MFYIYFCKPELYVRVEAGVLAGGGDDAGIISWFRTVWLIMGCREPLFQTLAIKMSEMVPGDVWAMVAGGYSPLSLHFVEFSWFQVDLRRDLMRSNEELASDSLHRPVELEATQRR